uniref:Uncharacterized protein n=1 Tax=Arundo donax TaxID=35708 RepID=A0A0A9A0L3_ARUDO
MLHFILYKTAEDDGDIQALVSQLTIGEPGKVR